MDKNLNFSLNVNDYQTDDFSPVPEGEYTFSVKSVERLALKNDPDASRLAVSCEILGPSYAGRTVFINFNLWHPSEDTTKIAIQELARFSKACGIEELKNLAELEGKPFSATCEIDGNYNRLKKFKPASGATDTSSTLSAGGSKPQPAAGPSQQQGINTKKKPW